jgi:hypothetical protein
MTAFQKWCREESSKDLQHYTQTYEAIEVEYGRLDKNSYFQATATNIVLNPYVRH